MGLWGGGLCEDGVGVILIDEEDHMDLITDVVVHVPMNGDDGGLGVMGSGVVGVGMDNGWANVGLGYGVGLRVGL